MVRTDDNEPWVSIPEKSMVMLTHSRNLTSDKVSLFTREQTSRPPERILMRSCVPRYGTGVLVIPPANVYDSRSVSHSLTQWKHCSVLHLLPAIEFTICVHIYISMSSRNISDCLQTATDLFDWARKRNSAETSYEHMVTVCIWYLRTEFDRNLVRTYGNCLHSRINEAISGPLSVYG